MSTFINRARMILDALVAEGGAATRFEIGFRMAQDCGTDGKRPQMRTMESMVRLGWVERVPKRSDVWRITEAGRSEGRERDDEDRERHVDSVAGID